jgi:hypothetical protein
VPPNTPVLRTPSASDFAALRAKNAVSCSAPLSPTTTEIDGTVAERFSVEPSEPILLGLITDIFERYWDRIHFGACVQGGVWEIAVDAAPQSIRMLDGYVTVDFGRWHCHHLSRDQKILHEPDWNALDMWDDLRRRYAGLESDPKDRNSRGFRHG